MARINIYSGRRGRPLSIDPDDLLNRLISKDLPKMNERLAKFRRESAGVRDAEILGTETQLPGWAQATIDALVDLQEGINMSYEAVKQIKRDIKTIEQLGSRQQRVYGRALEPLLSADYEQVLDRQSKNANSYIRQRNVQAKRKLHQMTSQERQSFYFSKYYQDPRTTTGTYEHIKSWAREKSGQRNLSMSESWAFLREQRLNDYQQDIADEKNYKRFFK